MFDRLGLWALRRLLIGESLNGELAALSEPFRTMANHLADVTPGKAARGKARREAFAAARAPLWEAMMAARPDRVEIIKALAGIDPEGPPPETEAPDWPATLADVRRVMSDAEWLWPQFIPAARITGIAAFEGVGKTRFAMDLARRVWFGLPWPDGQPATLPEGTRTLWLCADGQQDDLAATARAFGIPDDAVILNTTPDDPYGGTELDDPDELARFTDRIILCSPGLVFIDTLTNSTNHDLCRANEVKALMTPLRDIAQQTQTTIIPLLHLAKDGQALGRRIKGSVRTLLQLDCPDPDHTGRLKLSVVKSFDKKPPALGVTMTDGGNDYDFNPPSPPEPNKPGRPPEARDKAARFIRDRLMSENDQIGASLAAKFEQTDGSGKTFWRAVEAMEKSGELAKDGGPGTGKQAMLHLIRREPESAPPV
jgi:hypothetical protein